MKARPLLRLAPWLLLVAVAFAAGHWRGLTVSRNTPQATPAAKDSTEPAPDPASKAAAHHEDLLAELAAIAEAAKSMSEPDARTHAFFENLEPGELAPVAAWIEEMPPGNEQDALFVMALRRWGEIDGPGAIARADAIPNLVTRIASRGAAYLTWGKRDSQAAYTHALAETDEVTQARALAALLPGAAITYPGGAITLWEGAPKTFRESGLGLGALERIVDAAYGTGQREKIQAIIQGLPMDEERMRLVVALARNWGIHYPDDVVKWIESVLPPGQPRNVAGDAMFDAYVRKDPPHAAQWALAQADEPRRSGSVAAAVAEWAELDSDEAETWINEQPEGSHLEGANYAMAAHFIERRNLTRAFSWIRRINRGEARAELLGNLGRIWAAEQPEEFKKFLDETSLNSVEVEMLLSKTAKIPPS